MRSRVLCICFVGVILCFVTPRAALASEPATWQGAIQDAPVWITVVPRGHDISAQARQSDQWWQWGNTTTDAYLFAFNHRPGIIKFAVRPRQFKPFQVSIPVFGH